MWQRGRVSSEGMLKEKKKRVQLKREEKPRYSEDRRGEMSTFSVSPSKLPNSSKHIIWLC